MGRWLRGGAGSGGSGGGSVESAFFLVFLAIIGIYYNIKKFKSLTRVVGRPAGYCEFCTVEDEEEDEEKERKGLPTA